MKLTVNHLQLNDSPENFLHSAGYARIFDSRRQVASHVRRLGTGHYPRLHLYFDVLGDNVVFNLHLDQKEASYEGSHMHSAEYDSELVANEIARLRDIVGLASPDNFNTPNRAVNAANIPADNPNAKAFNPAPNQGDWRADLRSIPPKEKTWWQKIFS
ncbi:MAG: hypothetical protein WCK37_02155 [Candidatus Falkowbacteria bacterium]